MICVYGVVPNDFGDDIAIPLVKKFDGDRTVSDNYRCITLRPVITIVKLYEMTIMKLVSAQLQLHSLQYGFKRNSSYSRAIFTIRTVVERYMLTLVLLSLYVH